MYVCTIANTYPPPSCDEARLFVKAIRVGESGHIGSLSRQLRFLANADRCQSMFFYSTEHFIVYSFIGPCFHFYVHCCRTRVLSSSSSSTRFWQSEGLNPPPPLREEISRVGSYPFLSTIYPNRMFFIFVPSVGGAALCFWEVMFPVQIAYLPIMADAFEQIDKKLHSIGDICHRLVVY